MMEPEQPDVNASSLPSELLEAQVDEDRGSLGVDSEGLEGVSARAQGLSLHEQGNLELLVRFDRDEADTHDILQPQRVIVGTERHSEDERKGEGNKCVNQESDAVVYSFQQQRQNASIDDDEEGSSQERPPYESTHVDTHVDDGGHDDDDDDDDDDDEQKNPYVLNPQEFDIHADPDTEVGISFGILDNVPQAQNTGQEGQQEKDTDYTADDEENGYIRQAEPSPPEADLGVEDESSELRFDPDGDDDHDGDESSHIRRSQPSAQEYELETAQEPPEMQFEPEEAAEQAGDEIDRYFRQYQHSASEDDLEIAQESPEMQFEPEDAAQDDGHDMNRYFRRSQPAREVDLEPAQDSPELQFEPEDAADHDDDDTDRYFRSSRPPAPEVDLETARAFPELQFEPEDVADRDGDEMDPYFRASQPPAPEDELETAQESPEMQFEPEDAVEQDGDEVDRYLRQYQPPAPEDESPEIQFKPEADLDHDNGDDINRYFVASGTLAPEVDTEIAREFPEQHFEPGSGEYQYTHHSQPSVPEADLDGWFPVRHSDQYVDDESGEANDYVPESQRVEDESPEIQFQSVDDKTDEYFTQSQTSAQQFDPDVSAQHFEAEEYGNDDSDGVVGGGVDGTHYTSQLHNAVQAGVEDESPQLESQPSDILYVAASHDGGDGNDGEWRSYRTYRNEDQALGIAHEHHSAVGTQDSPRVFIKGILSEGNFDERYAENEYEEGNEEEEDDTDDAIDIRDNANVVDQFIELEDASYVEAAVGGILEDAELNGVKNGSQEESAGNEAETAAAGGDGSSDHDGAEGDARTSASRVRFAEEDRHAQADGVDDYHIIPDASNQPSYSSHDYDLTEGEEKSLDVLLLEEICEEAASMTIKEALIHSLKPNVRAGLTTAHLRLSESEVLALEEYCEDFVGGLIKDLLKRSSLMDLSSKNTKNVVKASVIKSTAKQLSAMEVQQMKIYCDHFVHNVIAESIIDSSMIVARQQHQEERVKEVLHMFQNSEELQEYFTNLTTDIVRTALLNVTAKEDLNDNQGIEKPIILTEYEHIESAEVLEFEDQDEDFDFDGAHSFGFLVADDESSEYRRSRSQESWTSEDEEGMGTSVAGGRRGMTGMSPPGHSTLEFDEEWAEGVIGNIDFTTDGEKRQKIFMRELDFDDRANVAGTELLAPVFLAVAEDNEDDTEFEGLRRKTQSIEDLCDLIEEEKEPPRKRASSLTQLAKKKPKPRQKPRPNSFHEQIEELKKEAIKEDFPDAELEEEHRDMSPESPSSSKTVSEKSFQAYDDDRYRWHTIRVNNREKVLDLKLIEPYMKVITHGGVHTPSRSVIVVIAACYLPDKTKRNYDFLMEQLFFYLISTLELLATTDEYFLVYFNGGTTQNNQPALPWMKRFYQHVEGGLKKNMIHMFIVHPNFWLKTVVRFAKAFVGTTFWSKLQFIKSLDELSTKIPVEFIYIPDEVIRCDPKYKRVHNL